jgi:myo-inositol catabolism protein IolC
MSKQQLAQLIEAYAAARASGNGLLIEFATGKLLSALDALFAQSSPTEQKP